MNAPRSGCPINLTLEALGDRWSLIVIRDLMFGNRRHFRELLTRSEERIASNILADRLTRLEKAGLVSRRDDPSHKQKVIYSLTEASIALVPLLAHMGGWGMRQTPASKELSVRAKILEDGGPLPRRLNQCFRTASSPTFSTLSTRSSHSPVMARMAASSGEEVIRGSLQVSDTRVLLALPIC